VNKVVLTCELLHSSRKNVLNSLLMYLLPLSLRTRLIFLLNCLSTWLNYVRRVMEVYDFRLQMNTQVKREKSSMTVKTYLEPLFDSFGKGPQPSVCINSNTSPDLDSPGFGTLYLYFEKAHRLEVKLSDSLELSIHLCRVSDSHLL
jgi:hypothetical protein